MNNISARLYEEKVHPMDNGSLCAIIQVEGHKLLITPRWETCGEIRVVLECSCGFSTEESPGRGCWQWGHNESKAAELDDDHADILFLGLVNGKRKQQFRAGCTDGKSVGATVEWRWLAELVFKNYSERLRTKRLGFRAWKESLFLVQALS